VTLYVCFRIYKSIGEKEEKIKDLSKKIELKNSELQREIAKWKGLADRFPQGIVILCKEDYAYSNRSLENELKAQSSKEARDRVVKWCYDGKTFGSPD